VRNKRTYRAYEIRRAENKHRKFLKRKYKRYDQLLRQEFGPKNRSLKIEKESLYAPANFSLFDNREEVAKYFLEIRKNIDNKIPTIMDMATIERTDFVTICFLIATMMDGRERIRTLFQYLTVRVPRANAEVRDLFDKAQFLETVTKRGIADHGYFLSRLDKSINKEYSLDILNRAQKFFQDKVDLATLSPILTEIFTNTNNHANPDSQDDSDKLPWFASSLEVPDEGKICYSVIDLGVGIHQSLSDKGVKLVSTGGLTWTALQNMFSTSQGRLLSTGIPGGVNSSTKLLYRGQGLKDIYDNANLGPYRKFELITNKARVNLKDASNIYPDSTANLEATIYYWEIQYDRTQQN
jgi:hypothetical protein